MSGDPSSGQMNPKPFLASNHFTVPLSLASADEAPSSSLPPGLL